MYRFFGELVWIFSAVRLLYFRLLLAFCFHRPDPQSLLYYFSLNGFRYIDSNVSSTVCWAISHRVASIPGGLLYIWARWTPIPIRAPSSWTPTSAYSTRRTPVTPTKKPSRRWFLQLQNFYGGRVANAYQFSCWWVNENLSREIIIYWCWWQVLASKIKRSGIESSLSFYVPERRMVFVSVRRVSFCVRASQASSCLVILVGSNRWGDKNNSVPSAMNSWD